MPEILVGRQPIFGRDLSVFGYELLFRNSEDNRAEFVDGDAATGRVILNAFLEIGLDNLVGSGQAFINFTKNLIIAEACRVLPKDRIVLEVLENIEADEEVVVALTRLTNQGYILALDDFSYRRELEPLLSLCHMVKLDVLALGREGVREQVKILKPRRVRLVAEKIDTHEEFEFCKALGFDLFQGFFLSKPNTVREKSVASNRPAIMQLLSRLQRSSVGVDELVADINMDVALVYKLLRYVNSAVCGLSRKVGSLREAVIYVGTNRIRAWAHLILLGSIEDKPRALVATAVHRAKMCELLAHNVHVDPSERWEFFSVGLLSVLDAMLDRPMAEILAELKLPAVTCNALLRYTGLLGEVLRIVLAYEQADWSAVEGREIEARAIKTAYLESLEWATVALREITLAF